MPSSRPPVSPTNFNTAKATAAGMYVGPGNLFTGVLTAATLGSTSKCKSPPPHTPNAALSMAHWLQRAVSLQAAGLLQIMQKEGLGTQTADMQAESTCGGTSDDDFPRDVLGHGYCMSYGSARSGVQQREKIRQHRIIIRLSASELCGGSEEGGMEVPK